MMWKVVVPTLPSFRYQLVRTFSGIVCRYSTAETNLEAKAGPPISKEVLLKMRKETGYSYVKCRKALVACGGEQNYEKALRWIREAAIKEGWNKAAKLSSRKASQGLIGLASNSDNLSVLVELNCETDFVARSAEFKKLVVQLVNALLNNLSDILPRIDEPQKLIQKNVEIGKLRLADGQTAEDAIVSIVSKIGENIQLACASVILTSTSNKLFGQAHPKDEYDGVLLGRFVSFVSLGRTSADAVSGFPSAQLGQNICQHIIGMAPESLGKPEKKRAKRTTDQTETEDSMEEAKEEQTTNAKNDCDAAEDEDLNASQVDQSELTRMDENETQLLHQPFMLNPEQTVLEYLEEHGTNITGFLRIEMGKEESANTTDSTI